MEYPLNNKIRISEKAKELFIQYGIRSVSMSDIANAIGMSKKTLYQYYTDKESLVADTMELILKWNIDNCEKSKEIAENAIHESFLASRVIVELMKKANPGLLFDMQKYYPSAFKRFEKFKQEYLYNIIKENIEWGIKDGVYREDINIALISNFRIETTSLTFQQDFYNRVHTELADIHQEITLLILYGIATTKGIKLINKYKEQKAKK